MTIYFAADHAGFEMKNELLAFVRDELGFDVTDCGASVYDAEDDYPAIISVAAQEVRASPTTARAIILGGSGQGEAIVANRFSGVRAIVYYGGALDIITLSREHNDANMLSLGARFLTSSEAKAAVKLWLSTEFTHEPRHERRIHALV